MSAEAFAQAGEKGFNEARPTSEGGGVPYAKLDKETGDWSLGQEHIAVPDDALWGVFPSSFSTGFVAWKGLTLEGKRMATIGQPAVDPGTLPPVVTETGWEPNVGVVFVCVDCPSKPEFTGTVCIFEQRSKGGIEAWNKLYDATMARAKGGHDDFAAIVQFDTTSYEHKKWSTVFKPIFTVEEWDEPATLIKDFGEPPALVSKEANDKEAEGDEVKPVSRHRKKDDVVDAEVVEDQAPRRRRRNK
jgi:hypothetical protein